jgi:hypothetical protein
MSLVTFALTSCGRPDLLERTLDSFLEMNTYPIAKYIIIEDSGIEGINKNLEIKYENLNIDWIVNPIRLGQMKSIDIMYAKINTEYIFHCEEDWLFTAPSFIEKSIAILESNPKWLQVWLRDQTDTNGHTVEPYSDDYDLMTIDFAYWWSGFSFNPGLRRLADYKLIGSYEENRHEGNVSVRYKNLGYRAAILKSKHVEHIGWGRHVEGRTPP